MSKELGSANDQCAFSEKDLFGNQTNTPETPEEATSKQIHQMVESRAQEKGITITQWEFEINEQSEKIFELKARFKNTFKLQPVDQNISELIQEVATKLGITINIIAECQPKLSNIRDTDDTKPRRTTRPGDDSPPENTSYGSIMDDPRYMGSD